MSDADAEKALRKRTSEAQRSYLIDYMNGHSIFAKTGLCPGNQGKEGASRMWAKLTEALNAIGPAERSAAAWKQTWHDLKKRIKQKAGLIVRARRKTGGESPTDDQGRHVPPLTAEEEIVYTLCGREEWVGQGEEEEIGLRQPSKISKVAAEDVHHGEGSFEERQEVAMHLDEVPIILLDDDSTAAGLYEADCQIELEEFISFGKQNKPTASSQDAKSIYRKNEPASNVINADTSSSMFDKPRASSHESTPKAKSVVKPASAKTADDEVGIKKRKRPQTIRETYEDSTSKYIQATHELTAAYQEHTAALKEQTEALKAHTEAMLGLKDFLPSMTEAVQTVGENLPSAILQLAYSMKAGNASGRKDRVLQEMNNNTGKFL